MKTWTLVWFLIFPPAGVNKDVSWEFFSETNLTQEQCFEGLAEKEAEFSQQALDGNIKGFEIYCKGEENGK